MRSVAPAFTSAEKWQLECVVKWVQEVMHRRITNLDAK